jgi:hypothetical protein
MRAPNPKDTRAKRTAAGKRKITAAATAWDRARAKLAALGWDTPSIEQFIEQWSEEGLEVDIEAERLAWAWNWQRRHWGRTPDQDRNQSLLDGYGVAKSQGVTMRDFAKQWFRQWYGREATLDDIKTVERQIDRLLKK